MRRWLPAVLILLTTTPAIAQIDPTPAEAPSAPPQIEPPPPPPPPPPPEAPPPGGPLEPSVAHRSHHIYGSIEGGYSYQSLYSIPITGLNLTGILGVDLGGLEVGGLFEAVPGRTEGGLDTLSFALGPIIEGHFDRVRLGGGLRVGTFNVTRATDGTSLLSTTLGLFGRLTVDVVQFGNDGGLFLFGKGSLDTVGGALYGLSAGIGVRF